MWSRQRLWSWLPGGRDRLRRNSWGARPGAVPDRGCRMTEDLFKDGSNSPGMLVTIDGPNGSGKTSLTAAVAAELRGSGASVHTAHQPSEGVLGRFARSAEAELRGRGLACLVAADRHQQVEGELTKHLRAGEIVLCDRYVESSLVLQRLDGVEVEFILAINAGIPRPDLRIQLKAEAAK